MAPDQGGLALRGALECLAASQPPSPPGRCAHIRERVRRRRQQAAVSATAAAAIVATAATLWLSGLPHPGGGPHPARVTGPRTIHGLVTPRPPAVSVPEVWLPSTGR